MASEFVSYVGHLISVRSVVQLYPRPLICNRPSPSGLRAEGLFLVRGFGAMGSIGGVDSSADHYPPTDCHPPTDCRRLASAARIIIASGYW